MTSARTRTAKAAKRIQRVVECGWTSAGCAFCCRLEDSRRRSSIDSQKSISEIPQEPPNNQTQTNKGADRCEAGEEPKDNESQDGELEDLDCVVEGVRAHKFGLGVGTGVGV